MKCTYKLYVRTHNYEHMCLFEVSVHYTMTLCAYEIMEIINLELWYNIVGSPMLD